MQNCSVGGSGYLMKRECLDRVGLIRPQESFTSYCRKLADQGWINGWYYPFLYQEHMDDPRAPHSLLKTEEDFQRHTPLTAKNFGISSLEEWLQFLRDDAVRVQAASFNPKHYTGWRGKLLRLARKLHIK